jgi:hypothetical protein
VAPPALKRAVWVAASAAAATLLVALALHGQRPEPGLVRFEAAGVMLHIAPARADHIEVKAGDRAWRFSRTPGGAWAPATEASGGAGELSANLDKGLQLLHASKPERVMTREEIQGLPAADFGLAPPRLSVSVGAGSDPVFTIHLGNANPLGLARYARIEGGDEVLLLPGFVAEPWERAVAMR